jgi:hypothetical protein
MGIAINGFSSYFDQFNGPNQRKLLFESNLTSTAPTVSSPAGGFVHTNDAEAR